MARHSTGAKNNKVAGSFIATILAIVVVIALIIWWLTSTLGNNESDDLANNCVQGDLTLKVASVNEDLASSAIEKYNSNTHVVQDYCVTAEYTDNIEEAGVFITAASDGTAQSFLASNDRSPATLEWPTVDTRKVGAAAQGEFNWDNAENLTYATRGNSLASAFVLAGLNPEDQEAIQSALREARGTTISEAVEQGAEAIAVSEINVPDGYDFTPLQYDGNDVTMPIRAIALNPTDTVNEDQTRAGADFGVAASEGVDNPLAGLVGIAAAEALGNVEGNGGAGASDDTEATSEQPAESSAEATTEQEQPAASAQGATTTLYLLDTSDAMGAVVGDRSWYRTAADAISAAAPRVGENHSVGLWNYSSPLNPGVVQGWRTNVAITDNTGGQSAAAAVQGFGTAGQPQTLSALSAALKNAAEVSTPDNPARVVLIASGATDNWDLADAVATAKQNGVILDVVHVGEGELNPAVENAATELGGTTQNVTAPNELAGAIESASGL